MFSKHAIPKSIFVSFSSSSQPQRAHQWRPLRTQWVSPRVRSEHLGFRYKKQNIHLFLKTFLSLFWSYSLIFTLLHSFITHEKISYFLGSYDRSVCLWDCRSRNTQPIQTMSHATGNNLHDFLSNKSYSLADSVTSLAFAEYEIIVGSVDGHIRTYDIRKSKMMYGMFW